MPDSVRTWICRERGTWSRWAAARVDVGRLDDGRWYVEQAGHDVTGPWRAELYSTYGDARTVAEAVMASLAPELEDAGYLGWIELY